MTDALGRSSLLLGTSPECDVQVSGHGIAPRHAELFVRGGELIVLDLGAGQTVADGRVVAPGERRALTLRSELRLGETPVSLAHPAVCELFLARGDAASAPGSYVLGRDPARSDVVVAQASVSGAHARVEAAPLSIVDLGSSSGTWVGATRLQPNVPHPLVESDLVSLGPVVVTATLLRDLATRLAQGAQGQRAPQSAASPMEAQSAAQAPAAAGPARVVPAEPFAMAPVGGKPGPASSAPRHRTVIGEVKLPAATTAAKTIGRTSDNDIVVPHTQVSSHHALLHREGTRLFIEDQGSANGTYVRGERISTGKRVPVENGEKVFVGPVPLLLQVADEAVALVIQDEARWAGRPLFEIEAWDLTVQVPDRDNPGVQKTLIDHVSFKALPGDLIALMGPSGAGKTTLLLTLNGYLPPTAGQVRINGEDLYAIYDALRGSIGYVPQDDIVHPELTVWEAVRYSARMRLPPDYSDAEIDLRVETTLKQLGLDTVRHLQIGKPENKILSGGQRKRVNIAMELVTDPIIMFLDEPTSGLAADDTTALVELLSHLAKDTGKTIITTIHQPAKDEFEKFNLALILGTGGIPIFYGPTKPDAYRFFGSYRAREGRPGDIDNPRDLFAVLNERADPAHRALLAENRAASRQQARELAARQWNQEFFNPSNPTFAAMYSGRRAVGTGVHQDGPPRSRPKTRGQFRLLLSRYFRVKARDVSGTLIMLLQAPIIGALLALVFAGQRNSIPYWCIGALQELGRRYGDGAEGTNLLSTLKPTPDHTGPINFLVIAAVWFGTSNAAREIVKERAIYVRERMVNLTLFNYIFSKFLLLSLFCIIQCTILLTIVFFSLGLHGGLPAFGIELLILIVTSMNSVAVGLFLSTMVASSEAAMALTPIALIPQIVLGGLLVPMTTNPLLEWPMALMPARWGFEGVIAQERLAVANDPSWNIALQSDKTSLPDFVDHGHFQCALAQLASDDYTGAWGFQHYDLVWMPPAVLGGMMLSLLLIILLVLKRRDRI